MSLFNLHESSTKQNLSTKYLITVILTSGQEAAWMCFRKVLFSIQIPNIAYFPFQTSQLLFIFCQDSNSWYYWITHLFQIKKKETGEKFNRQLPKAFPSDPAQWQFPTRKQEE